MKRPIAFLTVLVLLALVPAVHAMTLKTQTKVGSATSGRVATGDCATQRSTQKKTLSLICTGQAGYARATYRFKLPAGFMGNPSVHVAFTEGKAGVSHRVVAGTLRVRVTLSSPGRAVISMVSVGYYVK